MSTQRVFRLPSKGAGYEAIQEHTEPIPQAQAHEVVIKIHATTLNYRDLAIAKGFYPFPVKENAVPLSDIAGTIHALGPNVTTLTKGDKVIANFDISNTFGPQQDWLHGLGGPIDGALQQYIALPASAIIKIPEKTPLTYPHLASLVCTGTTAWNALYGSGHPLKPGQTVLSLGTGGVSMTGLLLAHAAGARTIITSSSDEKLSIAREKYGADFGVNYTTTPNWADAVNEYTSGEGVDIIFENGGSGTIAQSLSCVARGGQIAIIGFLSSASQEDMPDVAGAVLGKGCSVRGINVGSKQLTEDLVRFACARGLGVHVERTYGFERGEVLRAFGDLERGAVGKIAIEIP
ncbi:hypothetical protein M409DRAFT_23486 [Zasmidium cellare ATCC 36951]|uniref:Enoyl reductase (ER) domain-containing protein n=1 Tax=Zasmidium cellare ATCC 36951 TaxID=1080233 RepID=A0A6A6CLI6_ZASCE|nr:uncharacterized protein M409DRAFT_23486 [Zasmidium cellare ATCC 36951]KAF2166296.1 hypothetical protein M409DRAFT_23486 [Zasmidium cellare ATCC 36951]